MKGATAALVGALLFFLGVLTASSEGSQVAPPSAIPLGVKVVGSPTASRTPARVESPEPAPASTTPRPAPEPESPPVESDPAATTSTSAPSTTTTSTMATTPSGPSSTTNSSGPPAGEESPFQGDSGGVEEVDGRVDCTDTGRGRDRGSKDSECLPEQDRRRERG